MVFPELPREETDLTLLAPEFIPPFT
uniref:Uncharacterized protein n=1 Tax=Arundo donax TaxID=35708 RepID=A0A0A8ZRT0_ARUDO